jgi:hypothetical protein
VELCPKQSGIRAEVKFLLKFQSKVCFGLSAFACVKDGSEYQHNDIFEWYNYQAWKSQMKDLLYVKEYWKPVFSIVMLEDMKEDQWEVLHLQACGFIRQWVDDNVLNHIIDETHACTF